MCRLIVCNGWVHPSAYKSNTKTIHPLSRNMAFLLLSWTIALKTLHLASIGMEIIYNEQLLADIMFYMRMLSMTACSTELSLHNLPYNHIKKDNVFESC